MKKRKLIATVGVMLSLGMMVTGCAKTEETPKAEVKEMSIEDSDKTQDTESGADITEEEHDAVNTEDAKKIPVKFTADTKAEHWIIQGGGAGIDMRKAELSDLEEGMGVELEGYFEGENFVAARVVIEEYI